MLNKLLINSVMINWDKIEESSYLRDIPALSGIDRISFTHPVTFFVGENGSGKSTLLEAIAVSCGFNPEGGTRNYNFSTYDSHSELCKAVRLSRGIRRAEGGYFLRAESFYNVATKEEEYSRGPGGRPQHYHEKSHGESFLTLLMEIDRCVKEGSQFIIASHSPILLGLPGAQILSFDDGTIHPCSYEETDSYQVTSLFINNRKQLLGRLLEE